MEYRKQEHCTTCGEAIGHVQGTVTVEDRGGVPVEIGWACSNGHDNAYPAAPRTPLHQGAVYLDEVAGLLGAPDAEVDEAVKDGLLATDFGGKGVWLGDLMRWKKIRDALVACSDAKRPELKAMLIDRFVAKT
jgi:hypothetical protein